MRVLVACESMGIKICRHGVSGRCKACNAERMQAVRDGVFDYIPIYRLNREAFVAPRGKKMVLLELAGFNKDCVGRYYKGTGVCDEERRNRLAELLGIEHDKLWTKKERKHERGN